MLYEVITPSLLLRLRSIAAFASVAGVSELEYVLNKYGTGAFC